MKAQLRLWSLPAAVLVLALAARYFWIEPPQYRVLCAGAEAMPVWHLALAVLSGASPLSWGCVARETLIATFAFHGLGYAALILGVASVVIRRRGIALLAVCVSLAGLVLYCFEASALGLLLSVLTLARLAQAPQAPVGPQHSGGEQQA